MTSAKILHHLRLHQLLSSHGHLTDMAKRIPLTVLKEMQAKLGFEIEPAAKTITRETRFLSDLTPEPHSIAAKTIVEYQEHERCNTTDVPVFPDQNSDGSELNSVFLFVCV